MMQTPSTQTTEHTSSCLQTSRWYHAMTLEERTATPLYPEQQHTGSEQAIKKLRRWKEQAPFDKGEFFANRLAVDYITEQDLLALLDESMEALQERLSQTSTPDWLIELARNLETDSSIATIAQVFGGTEGTSGTYALLQPFYVLLQSGIERFQAGVAGITAQHTDLPFRSEDLLALLLPNLARQMIPKLSRAVVLELHIARLRGQLLGDTSQERFSYYLQRLSQPEHLRTFLEEYCILARQLMMTIHLWVHCNLEFIRHLCADWQQILATFTPEQELGTLTEVAGGAGDTHRNGHSVMILTFHSGWRLVYKPRALGVDIHFQSLLTWLNARGNHPAFCTLKLINKGDYGWVEFAPDVECTSEEEIRRFYERQGGYLALLYALDAMDFHAENIIAAGEHPLLIDLEALFHPRVQTKYTAELDRPGWDTLTHSVMQIALLPQRIWSNAEFEGIDISGLGKMEGQLSPLPMPQWESIGSDEMKIVRERVKMAGSKNCPKLCGQPVQALDYIESIIKGFTSIYRLLVEKRSELVTSILPQFAHDEIRFIARATRTYALLLNESFHPNMLRDALKRERHFDHLWAAVEQQPYLQRLISAERADLCRGDIPLFTTYPDSRNIFTSQRERIAEFFSEPSIERVNRHLYQLGEEDMRRQIWMIHAAFTSTATEPAPASSSLLPSHHSPEPVHGEQLLLEARAIGDRLCELALWDNGGADWIGLTCVNERDWSIALAGVDLYSGLPGMILFLSHLGANTGEARYTLCARAALKTLHGIIQYMTTATELPGVGAFNGIGSCI
ncbi:MAG TPA: type 2 lanthipeptide synthetase LanM family protein, partial [Ktedonobacteraceae bacterium]